MERSGMRLIVLQRECNAETHMPDTDVTQIEYVP